MVMKILFIGDIVGTPGREVFVRLVPGMKARGEADVVIVNAENAAGGSGITEKIADELFSCGCDVITLGDHAWDKREVYPYLTRTARMLRPANFVREAPGHGSCVVDGPGNTRIGVITLVGRTFMKYMAECPFKKLDEILLEMYKETKIIVLDMHAETTSEKVAMGWYADGRVSAICGTHTHIQTADEKILPQGTAYITDVGMTGPYDSVIGQIKERIIERYVTGMPNKFEVAAGKAKLCGVLIDIDEKTGSARSIVRLQKED
jgi:metallophosphoesterase (TIGR00282 family)